MSGTRKSILAAAKKLSGQAPLNRLTFSRIAKEAGVSPQTVSWLFADRKALSDAPGISSEAAGNDSRTRLYHNIWIQVGRSIIEVTVSPDGRSSDDPAGLTERSIAYAIAKLQAALPGG